ncbi:hypothetical protein GLOIN_2v1733894, partial [Rhizophagus irregularis DAOM 181602=DAOM 197198]
MIILLTIVHLTLIQLQNIMRNHWWMWKQIIPSLMRFAIISKNWWQQYLPTLRSILMAHCWKRKIWIVSCLRLIRKSLVV